MKRFYQQTSVKPAEGGFAVLLDGKPVYTPGKNFLELPNAALAQALAEEWAAQGEMIDKEKLPLTGFAALALDIALPQRAALIEELREYGETDLLFYREDREEALQRQQDAQWQPWVQWAQAAFGTQYTITRGIMPTEQPFENKNRHSGCLQNHYNHWELASLSVAVKATTSLLLGHAFQQRKMDSEQLFYLSRLEENFQKAKWGEDAEAEAKAEKTLNELRHAQRWRDIL